MHHEHGRTVKGQTEANTLFLVTPYRTAGQVEAWSQLWAPIMVDIPLVLKRLLKLCSGHIGEVEKPKPHPHSVR